jgi:signal transduction histidine kinase
VPTGPAVKQEGPEQQDHDHEHARATSVQISARQLDGQLVVEVGDDGVGGADPDGWGLRGLGDRVAALDGDLRIDSRAGEGTRVTARLPCGS